MPDQTPAEQELKWDSIAEQIGMGLVKAMQSKGVDKDIMNVLLRRDGAVQALMFDLLEVIALKVGQSLHAIEEPFLPVIAAMVTPILAGLFGAEVTESTFHRKLSGGGGARGAQAIVDGFMKAIVGDTPTEIVPTDAGSKRVAAAAVQASLESTFNALVPELISDLFPEGVGHFEALTELPENIIRSLGVSRLVRRAIQPIVTVCCTTPATWHMNKLHRPTLLGASALARQIARHPQDKEKWLEDLRRDGYSEDRIEALLNEQLKFRSPTDAYRLVRAGQWSDGAATQHLRDQGYDEDAAHDELLLERLKDIEAFERAMATAAVTAYADGRIDEAELGGFVTGTTITTQERAQLVELAHARRVLSVRPLTPSEAEQCVKAKILSLSDYRAALRRDGRTEDAITALDLLLRFELEKGATVEEHRRRQAEELAAEKAARALAARLRAEQLAAERALKRRGSESTLEAAAIRGLIPLARVEEIYRARYDTETVGAYMELLAAQRQDYITKAAAAELAKQRAAVRGVDVGALERAATVGTLTLGEFETRLRQLGFTADDAGLLTATLARHLQDVADAKRDRDDAAAAAKVRQIDLGRFELLVRRGHRSLGDYGALLDSLGFDEASRAAMIDLLQLRINDDAADRDARAAAEARLRAKGLSLEQIRRAVLLRVSSIDDFSRFLVQNGFTADAQIVLMGSLRADVAEAEAARQRRIDAARAADTRRAPLSDLARAARLGIVPVAVYTARLVEDGYTPDDVALETDLLVEEIAAVQETRRARAEAEAAANNRGLSLAQTAQLVHNGRSTINAYRDQARGLGYSVEAADALAQLLEDELDAAADAEARRAAIAAAAAIKHVSLGQFEAGVLAGLRTMEDFAGTVAALGYGDDDAELLIGLLVKRIEKLPAAGARAAALDQEDAVRSFARQRFAADVIAGDRTPDQYAAWLTSQGYAADDVSLLVDLVLVQLANPSPPPSGA